MFARAAKTLQRVVLPRTASRAFTTGATRVAASRGRAGFALAAVSGLSIAATIMAQEDQPAQCAAAAPSKIPFTGVPGTVHERTFIAIKPDGVQRGLIAKIIARFEEKGYKLVGLKMIWATKDKAEAHYADLSKRPFFPALVSYFTKGPIVGMVWEGPEVIKTGRKILGATNPNAADPGTIRGDYCVVVGRNCCHGSDGPESAQAEIANWFTASEIHDWPRSLESWITEDN